MYFIYADGACSGNDSSKQCPGGYGYVILDPEHDVTTEGGGHIHGTTNNQMELTAVIAGLNKLHQYLTKNHQEPKDSDCTVITDSKYVCDNWNDYFEIWKNNGWKKSNGSPVLNIDLWKKVDEKSSEFKSVVFKWVKGHSNNVCNARADELAQSHVFLTKSGER
jgi:ribonuclease HI